MITRSAKPFVQGARAIPVAERIVLSRVAVSDGQNGDSFDPGSGKIEGNRAQVPLVLRQNFGPPRFEGRFRLE